MVVVTALGVTVWGCLRAPRASRAMLVVLSSPPAVLSLCGGCALFTVWFPLPSGGYTSGPAGSAAPVSCDVCCISCPSWLVLLLMSLFVLHLLLRVRLFGHGPVAPPSDHVCWGLLVRHSVALDSCHALSGSGLSLTVPTVWWSKLLEFSWTLCWVSFLSLPVFADSSGWLLVKPWLSTLRGLMAGGVTLVFCQGMVGLP